MGNGSPAHIFRLLQVGDNDSFSMAMQIFNKNATASEGKAENARLKHVYRHSLVAFGDLVKSTLGPKGMNKILQSSSTGEINVTNDGATILKAIQSENAAAKISEGAGR